MKKYVAIYMASLEKLAQWNAENSKEAMESGMEEWNKWAEAHAADIVEMGAPLGKNRRVTKNGIVDAKNEVCGYTVVQANSHEAATAIFADSPHLKEDGAWIDVLEWVEM